MPRQLISTAILDLLKTNHFLSAPQIVTLLHQQGRTVNKTTVYRALEKLETQNLICKHNLHQNELVYELRADHHDHLICTNCQRVEIVDCPVTLPIDLQGYKITHHHLSLYGLCPNCQN